MDPLTAIAAVNAAISLIEALAPKIKDLVSSGEITAEQQFELMARYKSLREKTQGQFSGPEWERSTPK